MGRPAGQARARRRHLGIALSFALIVLTPLILSGGYLYLVAKDQFASHVGFSVRTEEVGSAVELLGGITELSGSSSSDTDILYEFIQSQQMVRAIDGALDLKRIYKVPGDPVFALGDDVRIEALLDHWNDVVKIFYDPGSGLIEVRVLAFDAADAQAIARAVFEQSSAMINELSAIARADATRYAAEELSRAEERLKRAATAQTAFRNRTQIVDPAADLQGQMGILTSLQGQLAEALIELQLLQDTASASDPRVQSFQRRIEVIEGQIENERDQLGGGAGGANQFSKLLEEYQALELDREFAEKAYLSAQAAYDAAFTEAQRQSRYLATHIAPTLAETPEYPQRGMLMLVIGAFLLLVWSTLVMIYYSLRDRR